MNSFLMASFLSGCGGHQTLKPDEPLPYPEGDTSPSDTSDTNDTGECVPETCDGTIDPNQVNDNTANCILFTEKSADAGLNSSASHAGASLVDYDQDGLKDIFLLNYQSPNQMFQNIGGGIFQDVSDTTKLSVGGDSRHAEWADYDGDGDLDLLLSGFDGNSLYRNNAGVFTLLSDPDGIHDSDSSATAAWIGAGSAGSGFLIATDNGTRFYPHASGDQFVSTDSRQQAEDIGLDDVGTGSAIALADYDGDGNDDIYLANQTGRNRLFKNNGDGTYQSVEEDVGAVENGNDASTDVTWQVYSNDSLPSIYVADYDGSNHFYRNQGDGTFIDQAADLGIEGQGQTTHVAWGDYLNNGFPALFLGQWQQENLFYHPLIASDGTISNYQNLAHAVGIDDNSTTMTSGWLDDDADGDLDLFVVMYDGGIRLYQNNSHEVQQCFE